MQPALRVITQMPVSDLFDENGPLPHRRERNVYSDDIREMLRSGTVLFVVADVGNKPVWVPSDQTFRFWRLEVLPHLRCPEDRVRREQFPGEYFYSASEWRGPGESQVVLLEKSH
jgi:hypothetical protein